MLSSTRKIATYLAWSGAIWLIPSLLYLLLSIQMRSWGGGFITALGTAIWIGWILVGSARVEKIGEGFIWSLSVIYHGKMAMRGLESGDYSPIDLLIEAWFIPVGLVSLIAFVIWLRELKKKPNQTLEPTAPNGRGSS